MPGTNIEKCQRKKWNPGISFLRLTCTHLQNALKWTNVRFSLEIVIKCSGIDLHYEIFGKSMHCNESLSPSCSISLEITTLFHSSNGIKLLELNTFHDLHSIKTPNRACIVEMKWIWASLVVFGFVRVCSMLNAPVLGIENVHIQLHAFYNFNRVWIRWREMQ